MVEFDYFSSSTSIFFVPFVDMETEDTIFHVYTMEQSAALLQHKTMVLPLIQTLFHRTGLYCSQMQMIKQMRASFTTPNLSSASSFIQSTWLDHKT